VLAVRDHHYVPSRQSVPARRRDICPGQINKKNSKLSTLPHQRLLSNNMDEGG